MRRAIPERAGRHPPVAEAGGSRVPVAGGSAPRRRSTTGPRRLEIKSPDSGRDGTDALLRQVEGAGQTRAACDKYYSAANKLAEAQGCRATAAYNVAKKACAKKSGAKKAACLKAAKRKFTAAKAKVAKQAKAEKACQTAYTQAVNGIEAQISALDQNDPNYEAQRAQLEAQETAAGTTQQSCIKKAQSS